MKCVPARLLPVPGCGGPPPRFPCCYLRCQSCPEQGSAWMQPERSGGRAFAAGAAPPGVRSRALTCPPGPTEPEEGREAPDGIMRSRAANPTDLRRGEGWGGRASPPSCYREGEAAGGKGGTGGAGATGRDPAAGGKLRHGAPGGGGAPDGLSSSRSVPCRPRGAGSHRGGGCA